jgi:drug/metabolite transporter (DMT)-like permease
MDPHVAGAVLLSAALHAGWNGLVKGSRDPLLSLATIIATAGACGLLLAFFVSAPPRAAWPWLAASMLLHGIYHVVLARSYRLGDLSQVYPIARGVSPPLLALLAALVVGERPSAPQLAGLALASASVASLGLARRAQERGAVGTALAAGVLIASYSLVDGQGSRVAGVLSFIAWSHIFDTVTIAGVVWLVRRRELGAHLRAEGWRGVAGGLVAIATYSIVLWAMTQAPLAQVSMLRETGVLFGALLGTVVLREPLGGRRIAAATGVCAGTALLLGGA